MLACLPKCRLGTIIGDVMIDVLFYQLLVCAVIIAFNLFSLESTKSIYDLHSIVSFTELTSTVVPTYIYCSLSDNFTSDLEDIGDVFYESTWFKMPVKYQRFMIMPIMRSQREIRLSGFGLIDCSLNVFLAVGCCVSRN